MHPLLAVVFIYPLIGMVIRLGVQTRQRRVEGARLPASTGREHNDLGQWLAVGVVAIVLIALAVVISTDHPLNQFPGGSARALELLLVLVGTFISLVALWRSTSPSLRLAFALITWAGVLGLGAQPEVFRLSDNPFQPEFWQSHYWSGVAVTGLMLFSLGARQDIVRQLHWRRVHVAANVLAAMLFVIQGMTGARDLLEIPLHWQKPALEACNWASHICPAVTPLAKP